jgi:hypothetical protein
MEGASCQSPLSRGFNSPAVFWTYSNIHLLLSVMTSRPRYCFPIVCCQHVVSTTEEDTVSGSLNIARAQVHTTAVPGAHALHLMRPVKNQVRLLGRLVVHLRHRVYVSCKYMNV